MQIYFGLESDIVTTKLSRGGATAPTSAGARGYACAHHTPMTINGTMSANKSTPRHPERLGAELRA